jgi:hypothetical protein
MMIHPLKKYSFCAVIAVAVLLFAGCSKKNRCGDCPKWSKIEAKSTDTKI